MTLKIRLTKKNKLYEPLIKLSWVVALFGYFFQFPLGNKVASLIVPFMGLYIAMYLIQNGFTVNGDWMKIYLVFILYLSILGTISSFKGVELSNIFRFYLILIIIPITTVVKREEIDFEFSIFIFFALIKCFILFYFAFNMIRTGQYAEYRSWASYKNHFGDIYISETTHLPCVQVMGNAIIPMAAILNDMYSKNKPIIKNIISFILVLGTLTCGNSAFLLCLASYIFFRLFRQLLLFNTSADKKIFITILLLIFLMAFGICSVNILEQKAEWSNAVRAAQAKLLLSGNIITGNGLANPIYGFAVDRTYVGSEKYFELQTLYILNQIGAIGIGLFYLLMCSNLRKYGKNVIAFFGIYLLYTFWNPYCFDTTEMIIVIILINLNKRQKKLECKEIKKT